MFGNYRNKRKKELYFESTTNLSSFTISRQLDKNIQMIYQIFKDDCTIRIREFENYKCPKIKGFIAYIEGMIDSKLIIKGTLNPLVTSDIDPKADKFMETVRLGILYNNEVKETTSVNDIVVAILRGDTAIFFEDEEKVLIVSSKGFETRGIEEPEAEKILRGPKEGFTECLSINLSLIRRKIVSNDMKIVSRELGRRTKTKIAICYMDSLVNKNILKELNRRLDKIDINAILDSNYICELIKDGTYTPFKTIGLTERPDSVASKLLEGRIALLVEGSPSVLTLPFLFLENFQTTDDYYLNYIYASFNRLIRFIGFFITILTPALYLSLVTFHRELIPTDLALSISQSRSDVPLPTIVELLILLLVFELIRESSLRTHSNVIQSISIVGALVIGQSAVEARFISAPMVIVIALTAITELLNPKIKGAAILIRLIFILAAFFIGAFGIILTTIVVLTHVFSLKSFGIVYTSQTYSFRLQELKDFYIRAPWGKQKTTPKFIANDTVMNATDIRE